MTEAPRSAAEFVPSQGSLAALRDASQRCRGCDLYQHATQAVFGEGPADAPLVLVGEQPGDKEDQEGHPFVGPAGKLLDRALEAAAIDRQQVYVTNAVKHFKFKQVGKRRIHDKPKSSEIKACKPWLDAELEKLAPKVVVALGASAAYALLGPKAKVTTDRGKLIVRPGVPPVVVTVHPSSLLRTEDADQRHKAFDAFVADLRVAAGAMG